jgi:signal transduction histidine kinase
LLSYANPIRLDPVPCDLTSVWREAWADVAGSPGFTDAELIEAGGDGIPIARVDGFQLRRVFRNLFDNARTATTGPLRVTISWGAGELAGRPALRVGVRDNGPGFPPGSHGRLFEAFFTTKTRGTGLGLALCQRVIEEHGGRIRAGRDGPGAEVIITLPRSTS